MLVRGGAHGVDSLERLTVVTAVVVLSAPAAFAQAPDASTVSASAAAAPAGDGELFPEGAQFASLNLERAVDESALGRAANRLVLALQQQRQDELGPRRQALQAAQLQLDAGAAGMSEQGITQVQRQIERAQVDLQRVTEDAQAEVQALETALFSLIERRLLAVVQQVFAERELLLLFHGADPVLIRQHPALDLTSEVIERFDQANPAAAP